MRHGTDALSVVVLVCNTERGNAITQHPHFSDKTVSVTLERGNYVIAARAQVCFYCFKWNHVITLTFYHLTQYHIPNTRWPWWSWPSRIAMTEREDSRWSPARDHRGRRFFIVYIVNVNCIKIKIFLFDNT